MHRSSIARLVVAVVAALVGGLLAAGPATAATGGRLTVKVTAADGGPTSRTFVEIYQRIASGWSKAPVETDQVGKDGFVFTLAPGEYTAVAVSTGYHEEYLGGGRDLASAETVSLDGSGATE